MNIDKVKAEIERLKAETFTKINHNTKRSMVTDVANSQRIAICEQLLDFITSLPAEQPSEELEYLATSLEETIGTSPHSRETIISYLQQTAQWQKEKDIDKVCEWLNKNVVEYHPRTGELKPVVNLNAFREAMEDEQ